MSAKEDQVFLMALQVSVCVVFLYTVQREGGSGSEEEGERGKEGKRLCFNKYYHCRHIW